MSYSISEVTATGGNTFNIPFDYIAQSEIAVFVDGVSTSFTFTSANVIDITPAPASGALVRIKRTTSLTDRTVDFQSGAVLTEEDLDNSNIQVFHAAQEAIDAASESITTDADGKWNAQVDSVNRAIKNVADPTDAQDVVTKNWAETGMSSQLATATAKASEASTSASSASASETAAASSASTASTKASEASVSAANAAVSATNAAQSSASAATSATNAATSASNASTSESNASSDATTASNAASTATSQASVASSAATTATSQATSATNSANAAASSESNASTSATNAATSATSASTSASQAQGFRDTTLGYKNSAAASATGALSSENAAATSETNAAASESSVAADASTATTKASEAATSASNASTSATNAASSASAAAQSAIDAANAAGFDPADYAQTANNLSDLDSASSALTNLGIANHDDITVDGGGNVSVTGSIHVSVPSSYGNIEIGGPDGAYIDLKAPASDDYDGRIITTGTGLNIVSGSGGVTLSHQNNVKLATTSSGVSVTGNVGIGTSSPAQNLHISASTDTRIALENTSNHRYDLVSGDSGEFRIWDTAVGERLRIASNGNVGIGTSSPSSKLHVNGDITATGNVTAYSDIRLKDNIEKIDDALSKVSLLSGYTFDRTDVDTPRQTGVISQEVQAVLPEAVTETDDGTLTVAYGNMMGLMIEAIKELKAEIDELKGVK
jgi:hypothetical protein